MHPTQKVKFELMDKHGDKRCARWCEIGAGVAHYAHMSTFTTVMCCMWGMECSRQAQDVFGERPKR